MAREYIAFAPKSGTVHLTVHDIDASGPSLPTVLALCGRNLKATGIYASREAVINVFAEEHKRLSLTHETGLCRNCFDRHADIENIADTKEEHAVSTEAETKTASQVAHEVYTNLHTFPTRPTGRDLRELMAKGIEADRAQRAEHLAQGTARTADIERESTQERISEFADGLAATLDRDKAVIALDAMPASAKGSPMHAALVRRIESFGGAV